MVSAALSMERATILQGLTRLVPGAELRRDG